MSKKLQVVLILSIIIATGLTIWVINWEMEKDHNKLTVGFIMSGSINDEGWNGMHYEGIKSASKELGVEFIVKENVAEFKGKCKKAIKELVKEGANVIILSSYNYSQECEKVVKEYPNIIFYCNSSEYHDKNMSSYFARYYQGRYLAGVLAGLQTKSDKIGYVAAMNNNEVNRGINAFTLGVKSVNEDADVIVAWTGSWDDKNKEKKYTNALIDKEKVDVVTYHQNQSYVIDAADKKDVMSIGYHEEFDKYSDNYLTSVVCNWQLVYKEIIQECLQGRGNSESNYWIGMERNVVNLSQFSDKVSDETIKKIEEARENKIKSEDVFSGEIYDTKGKKRCEKGETISDNILLEQMDWFVEGVKFYEE